MSLSGDNESSDGDEGFLDGDIVDNIFNQKEANAHLEMDFELATKYVRGLAGSASQEDLLFFYARYKQATVGVCNVEKPSFYQLKEKSKWNAWTDLGSKSRIDLYQNHMKSLKFLSRFMWSIALSDFGIKCSLKDRSPVRIHSEIVRTCTRMATNKDLRTWRQRLGDCQLSDTCWWRVQATCGGGDHVGPRAGGKYWAVETLGPPSYSSHWRQWSHTSALGNRQVRKNQNGLEISLWNTLLTLINSWLLEDI